MFAYSFEGNAEYRNPSGRIRALVCRDEFKPLGAFFFFFFFILVYLSTHLNRLSVKKAVNRDFTVYRF